MVSRILGPDGQPINTSELVEPQTSRVAQLRNEWQGHPSRGLTPSKLTAILESAEQGDLIAQSELFEDMEERDGHISSEMGKRRRAPMLLDWDIEPPPNPSAKEKNAAKELKELLTDVPEFEEVVHDTTDAIGKGYSCQEIEWHRVEGKRLPKAITHRPQSWFRLFRGNTEEIRLRDNSPDGAPLQPFGWLTHTHKTKSGYLARSPMFRVLVWPYLFKNYAVGDLAEFLELYGFPLRVGKYPPGASEKDKVTLLRALASLGHNAAGIIPDGMLIDFQDAVTGDPDAFIAMIDWCERTQSKVILGGTLTSQADRGSNTNALGNVHNEVRKDLRDGDARQLATTLSRDLIYPIAALNGLADSIRRAPRFKFTTEEPEDVQVYSEALPKFLGMGFKISRQWAQQKVGIPEPENDEDLLGAITPAAPEPKADAKPVLRLAAATAQLPAQAVDREDQLVALLTRDASPVIGVMVDQLRELVAGADSLETIRDGLIRIAPNLNAADFAVLMQQALALASVAGESDALEDSRA